MKVVERMEEIREEKGFSSYRIAKMMGISMRTVYNWKEGKTEPTFEHVLRFLEKTDTPWQDFFESEEIWYKDKGRTEGTMLKTWRKLSERQKSAIISLMEIFVFQNEKS